jgi:trehalose 6-phosphate synthase
MQRTVQASISECDILFILDAVLGTREAMRRRRCRGWGSLLARLVVVSNRVSVPSDGSTRAGGLEVALLPALHDNGGVWLGWSGKVAPVGGLETRFIRHKNIEYVITDLSKEGFDEYYSGFANRVLWPILHYRLDLAEFARRDLSGYFRVNDHFATELEKIIKDDDLIWAHDYHLIPIADALRRRGHGFHFPRRRS